MGNKKYILIFSSLAVVIIIVLYFYLTSSSQDIRSSNKKVTDTKLLAGDWVRTDADYLIKIIKVGENGSLDAQYFNPKSINVESAGWEESNSNLKVFMVLRDVYYPGSKYTLNYLPERDILAGEYFQAVQGLTFYVEFTRNK